MRSFYRLSLSTLIAVYILVLVGGIVRSTGSGMGCPDWPTCFGAWVPPTSVAQLPDNYKEIYAAHREKKNVKFANYLSALGFSKTAEAILQDKSILEEADFNPVKTWVEYINRLVGVVIGLLIFAVFIYALRFWKEKKSMTIFSFLSFFLVGFQGWLGSFVVSTNLTPWTITIHMFLALVIVALLIVLVDSSTTKAVNKIQAPGVMVWLLACVAVVLIQILLGTQVREAIDSVASKLPRESWIENLGTVFIIHRSFSWVVFVLHVGLVLKLRKTDGLKAFQLPLILLILGTLLSGVGMAYGGIPPFLQPLHLWLASLTFGFQFLLFLRLNRRTETVLTT
ncbi:MAG: COX15/CtaA family protein [Cyclobacteriaceae bacterium]|nr:COX15/CtaA family protein [Cyclobacteriaceae bacterium]